MNKEDLLHTLVILASENFKLITVRNEALAFIENNFDYHDGVLTTIPTEHDFIKLKAILRGGDEDE